MTENNINKKNLRDEYLSRINLVIDYIELNIDQELMLKKLAGIANFSPFHFHRIFRGIIGEPLNQFVQRLRIEKGAKQLIENPKKNITSIAYDCGFSSSSSFAKVFKEYYDMSATEWRNRYYPEYSKDGKHESKIGQNKSKDGKDSISSFVYNDTINNKYRRRKMINKESLKVNVEDMPEMHVAYVRHIGPYKGDGNLFGQLFNRLFTWAGARGLLKFPETKVLSVYHDDPKITDESKLRTSVCITVPEKTGVDGEIGKMTIPGGKFAIARFELAEDEYEEAWNSIYSDWLPESGYQPDDKPCYELFQNGPEEHPENKSIVDICIPVKPL